MEQDLTQGSVSRALIRFVLPFLGASILQFLYAVMDMIIVGKFSDAAAISAVNTSSQIMQLMTSLISGITTGGTVLIGQYVGAKRQKDVRETIRTLFSMFLLMGCILMVTLLCCNQLIIEVMQVPTEAVLPARRYLLITSAGTLFIVGYNGVAGVLRGLGDSKRPMYFIACSCILNILGDLLLVGGFRWGASGAAWATVAAQAVSCVLSLCVLRRGDFPLDLSFHALKLDGRRGKKILSLGVPIAAQDVLVTLSFILITAVVNRMGLSQSAAVGVVERIIGFCMLVPIAFLSALSAFTAQNVGAQRTERAKQGLKMSILLCVLMSSLFFLLAELVPGGLVGLFTNDPQVIYHGELYLRTYSVDILMVAFVFCFNGFFAGYGHTRFTMANCLLSTFLVRVPLVFIMSLLPDAGLLLIGIAAPLASLSQIIMQVAYYKQGRYLHN